MIILGDAEELLEEPVERVIRAYENVFLSEARFHPDRLIRIFGNHDIHWQQTGITSRYLEKFFPGIRFRQELLLQYRDQPEKSGDIFLVHGHQGTLDSDVFSVLAWLVLPIYRILQILTGFGDATSPSRDACLRSFHDNRMYRWVSKKPATILIAGHTHRPIWSSKTHLEKLIHELLNLLQLKPEERPGDYEQKVIDLKNEIQERQEKYPPCEDIIKTKPAYFNTGCCQFDDGDITGIEIENGVIRLIKWGRGNSELERVILEQNSLKEIFFYLQPGG